MGEIVNRDLRGEREGEWKKGNLRDVENYVERGEREKNNMKKCRR